MSAHSLVIDRFATTCQLDGSADEASLLERRVERLAKDVLPGLLARALDQLLPDLHGVIRINRIKLACSADWAAVDQGDFATILARHIAEAVASILQAKDPNAALACWPDHESYLAAYVAHRLGIEPAPDWAFPEFSALAHLAPSAAAVEILTARPTALSALFELCARHDQEDRLTDKLGPAECRRLLEALVSDDEPGPLPASVLHILARRVRRRSLDRQDLDRATLRLIMQMLAADGTANTLPLKRLASVSRAIIALIFVETRLRSLDREDLEPEDLLPALRKKLGDTASAAFVEAALVPFLKSSAGMKALRGLREALPNTSLSFEDKPTTDAAEPTPARHMTSRHAGIGLLAPTIAHLDLRALLGPRALHRTTLHCLPEASRQEVVDDPLIAAFAPYDPNEAPPTFPPVPEPLIAALPETQRGRLDGSEGADGWAALLAAHFALGLPGLQESSLAYLQQQFLARPGRLALTRADMSLELDPLPLGVVLRMAGLHGWLGRFVHLGNRDLTLDLKE